MTPRMTGRMTPRISQGPSARTPPRMTGGGALEDVRGVIRSLDRHVERLERSLECALQRCDAATARAAVLEIEAAAAPALRTTVEALKAALESERSRVADLRAERDK